eukprot:m51a1_g12422 putative centrosomal protein of 290 kda (1720) ;mRNA; r:773478-780395
MNDRLKEEIDALEEERIKMRSALRMKALDNADKAVRVGLSASQLRQVDQYTERLKEGKDAKLQEMSRAELVEEIVRLRGTLQHTEKVLELAQTLRDESDILQRRTGKTMTMQAPVQNERTSTANTRVLLEENKRLKDFIVQHITSSDEKPQRTPRKGEAQVEGRASPRASRVDKRAEQKLLMEELERQKQRLHEELDKSDAEISRLRFECQDKDGRIKALERHVSFRQRLSAANLAVPDAFTHGAAAQEDVVVLNEQLIECLEQLETTEQHAGATEAQLAEAKSTLEATREQLALLYAEYAGARKSWDSERADLEAKLSKRAELENKILRKENTRLRSELDSVDQSFAERVTWLDSVVAHLRVDRDALQKELAESVPRPDYQVLSTKYEMLLQLHKAKRLQEALDNLAKSSPAEATRKAAELSAKVVELKIAEANANQRAQEAKQQAASAAAAQAQVEERARTLERELIATAKARHGDKDEIAKLAEQLQGSVPRAEASQLQGRIAELETLSAKLKAEARKQREMANISMQHLARAKAKAAADANDVEAMRATLTALQSRNDTSADEATSKQKIEELSAIIQRLSRARKETEEQLQAKVEALFAEREGQRRKLRELYALLDGSRRSGAESSASRLQASYAQLRSQRDSRRALESDNARLRAQAALLECRLASADGPPGESDAHATDVRVENAALRRTVETLRERERSLGRVCEDTEEALRRLEEGAVRDAAAWEARGAELVRRVRDLEAQLAETQRQSDVSKLVDEKRAAAGPVAVALGEAVARHPPLELPTPDRLKAALQRLDDCARVISELRAQKDAAAISSEQLARQVKEKDETLLAKDAQIAELSAQLGKATGTPTDRPTESASSLEALTAAQETIASLQAMLDKKDQAITKYHKTILEMKENHVREKIALEQQIAAAAESAHGIASPAMSIQKLREELAQAFVSPRVDSLPIEDVKRMTADKDERLRRLEQQIEAWRQDSDVAKARLETQVKELKALVQEKDEALSRLRQESVSVRTDLKSTRKTKDAIAAEKDAEIEALRNELTLEKAKSALISIGKTPPETPRKPLQPLRAVPSPRAGASPRDPSPRASPSPSPRPSDSARRQPKEDAAAPKPAKEKQTPTEHDKKTRAIMHAKDKKIAALEESMAELNRKLADHAGATAAINARAAAPDDAWTQKMDSVLKASEALNDELSREKTAKTKLMEERNLMREKIGSLQAEMQSDKEAVKKLRAELDRSRRTITESQSRVSRMQADLEAARAKSASLPELQKRITTLQGQLDLASKTRDALNDRLSALSGGTAEAKIPQSKQAQFQARIERFQDALAKKTSECDALAEALAAKELEEAALSFQQSHRSAEHEEHAEHGGHEDHGELSQKQDNDAQSVVDAMRSLEERVRELEGENDKLQKEVLVEKQTVIDDLTAQCASLKATVDELSREHQEHENFVPQQPDVSVFKTEIEKLNAELLSKDKAMVELRFEKENALVQSARQQQHCADLELQVKLLTAENTKKVATPRDSGAEELKGVIQKMQSVIEKLQNENASLKKAAVSSVKYMEIVRENKALKAELQQARSQPSPAHSNADEEKLRKALRELAVDKTNLEAELRELKGQRQDKISADTTRVAKLEVQVATLQQSLRQKQLDVERLSRDSASVDVVALQKENKTLRDELGALDPKFFSELAKLKTNYKEALRKNQMLEDRLQKLSVKYGFSL